MLYQTLLDNAKSWQNVFVVRANLSATNTFLILISYMTVIAISHPCLHIFPWFLDILTLQMICSIVSVDLYNIILYTCCFYRVSS